MPFGQKCGEMSASVSWLFASHDCVAAPNGRLMTSPILCTSRAWRSVKGVAHHQATATRAIAGTKIAKPRHELSCTPAHIMFRLTRASVMKTSVTWARMKSRNHHSAMKWIERALCRFSARPNQPSRFEIAGLCISPVTIDVGAAMKTVAK